MQCTQRGGKQGVHTEHLGYLLAEMQFLQRAYPGRAMVSDARRRARSAASPRDRARPASRRVAALGTVPDPEIPVVSIVELGIVRGVACDGDRRASSTSRRPIPAVPATEVIAPTIRERARRGRRRRRRARDAAVAAWTTDWIAPEAQAQARARSASRRRSAARGAARSTSPGISPLRRAQRRRRRARAAGRRSTRSLSQFGSTACKAQYRCDDCLEPFDYFKPH